MKYIGRSSESAFFDFTEDDNHAVHLLVDDGSLMFGISWSDGNKGNVLKVRVPLKEYHVKMLQYAVKRADKVFDD